MNTDVLEAWKRESGPLCDEAYDEGGPDKHEIEEMRTNVEYEVRVVECVLAAYDDWEQEGKPAFKSLSLEDKITVVQEGLETCQYGSYRGDLPGLESVTRALAELGHS
jgi:hypothetical protein